MTETEWLLLKDVMAYAKMGRLEVIEALHDGSLWGRQTKPGEKWRTNRAAVDAFLHGIPYTPPQPTSYTRRRAS